MISFLTAKDGFSKIAPLMRERRVGKNITQTALSERSGVSLSVLKKFEQTGKISLESFVKLAFVLGLTENLIEALSPGAKTISSLDELLAEDKKPKRKYAYSPRKKKSKKKDER